MHRPTSTHISQKYVLHKKLVKFGFDIRSARQDVMSAFVIVVEEREYAKVFQMENQLL